METNFVPIPGGRCIADHARRVLPILKAFVICPPVDVDDGIDGVWEAGKCLTAGGEVLPALPAFYGGWCLGAPDRSHHSRKAFCDNPRSQSSSSPAFQTGCSLGNTEGERLSFTSKTADRRVAASSERHSSRTKYCGGGMSALSMTLCGGRETKTINRRAEDDRLSVCGRLADPHAEENDRT